MKTTASLLITFCFWLLAASHGAEKQTLSEAQSAPPTVLENLTLEQALALAGRSHPQILEAKAMVAAAEGRMRQAGLFPNPEAIARVEAVPVDGKGDAEYLVGIGQRIPVNGSLRKGRQVESLDRDRLRNEVEVKKLAIHKQVHGAFATALYQERALETFGRIAKNSGQAVALTKARLALGDALPEEVARAEVEFARDQSEHHRANVFRENALQALAGAMGDPSLRFDSLGGRLEEVFEIQTLEVLSTDLSKHPVSNSAEAEIEMQRARVDLAKAQRIPDINVEVLYRRIQEDKRDSLDFGISFPLPLFNRNKGRIAEAQADLAAAEARGLSRRNEMELNFRHSQAELAAALEHARILQRDILPRLEKVMRAAEARYSEGDVSLNEVLPVRRDWANSQLRYMEALRETIAAWGAIVGLSTLAMD